MALTKEEIEKLRERCKCDLYFLAKHVLGYSKLEEDVHRPVCAFFVQKDPAKPFEKQDEIKDRLLLYPRGSFKSTINMADVVQWILCFPDISIQVLTATSDLAIAFVDEIRSHFLINDEEPTKLQQLFPEFCVRDVAGRGKKDDKGKGKAGKFWSPARKKFAKEPTVYASAITKSNSGWHPDLQVLDDVLDDQNTETPQQLDKIDGKIALVRNLVKAFGYRQILGTRYAPADAYGRMLERYKINLTYGCITIPDEFHYLCRPAWWLKGSDYKLPTMEQVGDREGIELLFPQEQNWGYLRRKLHENFKVFASQQLNDPIGASDVTFFRDTLLAATLPPGQVPSEGTIFVAWDLAYSTKKGRDYTVGAVGLVDEQRRLWVIDLVRGRFAPHELPARIVRTIQQWSPAQMVIENSPGAKWLLPELERYAFTMGVQLNIRWVDTTKTPNAKVIRVSGLETLLESKRLFFTSNVEHLEALYSEFIQFPGGHHDDIPDAIAFLSEQYLPQGVVITPTQAEQTEWDTLRRKQLQDLMYGRGVNAPVEVQPEPLAPVTTNPYSQFGEVIPGIL